jgi:general secretion pathway protein C
MVRYLSWLANAALLTLGCFLVANTANAVFAALLTPSPAERAPAPAPEPPAGRSWSDRQNLLGTVASPNPQLSWAAIEDKEVHKHLVLRLHDDVKEGKARVMRIEPKRVVLSENGELRELVLADNEGIPPPPRAGASKRPSRKPRAARRRTSRTRSTARPPEPPPDLEETIRNPAQLFSQARILPKYEDGEMVGVQVSAIQAGSLFEEIGVKDGDVITELNGIEINSPEESARILRELSEAEELTVTIRGEDGPEILNMPTPGH